MAVSITHSFVSPVADRGNPDEVGPDEWNDEHQVTGLGSAAEADVGDFATAAQGAAADSALQPSGIGVSVQAYDPELAAWAGVTRASGFDTFVATPSSANLRGLLTDKTGTGSAVFANTPTLVTPVLGVATATSVLARSASFTNTGTKKPYGFRADLTDADFTNGFGAFQSLIQLGTSSTPIANTDWPQLGPIDVAAFSGWVLNWGSTATTKQPIAGNFGIAFENVSTNPAHIQWAMELDVGNYTGTGAADDERYGVGLKLNAFGAVDSPATEAIGISRPSTANSGTGWLAGLHVDGARTVGYKFEAMTEVGSGYAVQSQMAGDTVNRFSVDYAGAHQWGSGAGAVDISLYRAAAGVLNQDGTQLRITSTDATAAEGPTINAHRNSASPAANDILGALIFEGKDDGGTTRRYGGVQTVVLDVAAATRTSKLRLTAQSNATNTVILDIVGNATKPYIAPAANDGTALGTGGLSFADLFLATGGVLNWNNGTYTVTQSSANLIFSGGVTLGTDLAVADGGTGASTGRGAAANLGTWCVLATSAVGVTHTGNTSETTLATIAVPANAMGANGMLRITALYSFTGTNAKTGRSRFGGTEYTTLSPTTQLSGRLQTTVSNRNATNSQVGAGTAIGGFGLGAGAAVTSAVDTTSSQNITLTGQLTNSGESITLESYAVELFYQA